MDQGAWKRALRRLGAAAIGGGALVLLALPWLLPPALRWAAAHLSRDHRVSGRGAVYAAALIAAVALTMVALGLLARRLARGALTADLRRLFGDPGGSGARGYTTLLAGWLLGLGLVAFAAAAPADSWVVSEAGAVEVLQVVTLLGAAVVSLRTAVRLRVEASLGEAPPRTFARAVHALVALAAIMVAAEELSWGQSIFHWSTPARWAAVNAQQETNLHNLYNTSFIGGYAMVTTGALLALAASTALIATNRDAGPFAFLLVRPSLSGPAAAMAASLLLSRLASARWFELVELCAYLLLFGWAFDNLRRGAARERLPERHLAGLPSRMLNEMPRHLPPLTLAVFALLAASAAPLPALSGVEKAIVAHVDAHAGEARALLERVVNLNSGTQNFAGVREVGQIFARELEALGFTTRWADGAAWGRAGHLIATRAGKAPKLKVLLIGHLDTVFEPDSPFQRYEALPGGRARGPGAIDMKGGDVILVHALAALRAAGALDRLDVTVFLTGDEEDSGSPLSLARKDLLAAAQGVDVALGFEDGDGKPEHAVVARRGSVDWRLTAGGKPAHSSQIFQPEVGAGAAYEAARILHGFYDELSAEPNLTFNPGLLLGGTAAEVAPDGVRGTASGKSNVVAGTVIVNGDLRTLSPQQLQSAQERMKAIAARHLPGTTAELVFGEGYPPMAPAPGNLELLAMLDQASRDLGLGPVTAVDPRNAGAADVSFVAGTVPRILDALGLKGTGGHTVEETADLATLPTQTKRAALLLYRLATGR